jgi:hypothetical protein
MNNFWRLTFVFEFIKFCLFLLFYVIILPSFLILLSLRLLVLSQDGGSHDFHFLDCDLPFGDEGLENELALDFNLLCRVSIT